MNARTKTITDTDIRQIPLAVIKLDPLAQPRAEIDDDLVAEYAEAMAAGEQFPPLVVFNDRRSYWLADGFHRHGGALQAGMRDIACIIHPGGQREAILHSCSANAAHGWRRSNGDKRRAVQTLLADDEWSRWSDREIARHAMVSHTFVQGLRAADTGNVASMDRSFKHSKTGAVTTMDTSRIGKAEDEPKSATVAVLPAAAAGRLQDVDGPVALAPELATIFKLAIELCAINASPEDTVAACSGQEERNALVACCGPAGERLLKITALAARPLVA